MNDAKTEILRVRMTPMEKAALYRQMSAGGDKGRV